MTDAAPPTEPAPPTGRGCIWLLAIVLIGIVVGVAVGFYAVSRSGDHPHGPSSRFIQQMCDTNEGGYYHLDPTCVRRYRGY